MQNLGDCTCSSYVYTSVTCILAISEFLCYSRRCKDVSLCTPFATVEGVKMSHYVLPANRHGIVNHFLKRW